MSSTWTEADLEAIEAAMASGALEVEYNDRRVKYRSMKELKEIRNLIRRSLGKVNRGNRLLCESSKGIE